nr:immunoglobulin heavy chain junction region [Mus musculus]
CTRSGYGSSYGYFDVW